MAAVKYAPGLTFQRLISDIVLIFGTAAVTVGWGLAFQNIEAWEHLDIWYRGALLWTLGVLTSGLLLLIEGLVRYMKKSTDHT